MGEQNGRRLVVVVTGANSGVGFAICQRLIFQLSCRNPSDARPQEELVQLLRTEVGLEDEHANFDDLEVTIIMACRNVKKAQDARTKLLKSFDDEIKLRKQEVSYDGHAEKFKRSLLVEVQHIDLGDIASVFKFSRAVTAKYPYVSHLVCNAGLAAIRSYDWFLAARQILTQPIEAVTRPIYKIQEEGLNSSDGLGWVWQCNVFGHFVLARLLQDHLTRYRRASGKSARVLWTSSLESRSSMYNSKDWQLINTSRSYEASKYQMDLISGYLEYQQSRLIDSGPLDKKPVQPTIRHILVHPGVVLTGIAENSLNNVVLVWLTHLMFYLARLLGSYNHLGTSYKAAVSAVHVMLTPLAFIPTTTPKPLNSTHQADHPGSPLRFGSRSTRWGNEYVGAEEVNEWEKRWQDGGELVKKCENLFHHYLAVEDTSMQKS